MSDSVLSLSCVLNEQIAGQVFDGFSEKDCLVAIIGKDGNYWPSDSEKFEKFDIDEQLLKELCARVDDGAEPVVTQIGNYGVAVAQLATERVNCGYLMIASEERGGGSISANMDIIEIIFDQINVIAGLIEKNNRLYELQMKISSMSGTSKAGLN